MSCGGQCQYVPFCIPWIFFCSTEAAHPITEEEFIKVENIRGRLFLVGAEDDALWDTAKYIHRIEKRLAEKPHTCEVEAVVYEH